MTIEFRVEIDLQKGVRETDERVLRLLTAIYKAIDYALDNDIGGAEALNRDDVGQITVEEQ